MYSPRQILHFAYPYSMLSVSYPPSTPNVSQYSFQVQPLSIQNSITFGTVICMLYYILYCCITSESSSKGPAHLSGVVFAPRAKLSLHSLSHPTTQLRYNSATSDRRGWNAQTVLVQGLVNLGSKGFRPRVKTPTCSAIPAEARFYFPHNYIA